MEISVDPSYETLVLHKIQIVRGRDRIDVIPTTTVRTLENDSGEERTYDDGVTEVFLLPDVRVGDILDYEYSIRGQDSVFGGRFVQSIPLVESLRTERLRVGPRPDVSTHPDRRRGLELGRRSVCSVPIASSSGSGATSPR